MVVVPQHSKKGGPDAVTPRLLLQAVESPAMDTVEGGGKGDRLESRQMQTRADL
jgi:hypothetical protein